MSFIGKNLKQNTATYTTQSSTPANPVEGMTFHSDGTVLAKGLWLYTNSTWTFIAQGSAGSLVVSSKTASFTASVSEDVYVISASTANITATLPTAIGNSGKQFSFVKTDSTTYDIIIDGYLTQTISGSLTTRLSIQYSVFTIVSDGSNWILKNSENLGTCFIKDVRSSGTSGGTNNPVGTWDTRVINTIQGDGFATLSGGTTGTDGTANQINLGAGKYIIKGHSQFGAVSNVKLRLQDVTAGGTGTTLTYGDTAIIQDASNVDGGKANIGYVLETSSPVILEWQSQCYTQQSTSGHGRASGFGDEVYTIIEITKLK